MFETINEWISDYWEMPYAERTQEALMLFTLGIAIYVIIFGLILLLIYLMIKGTKRITEWIIEKAETRTNNDDNEE